MNSSIKNLLEDFNSIRVEFISTIENFPANRISTILFGKWNLKDVIAHFVGWDYEFINSIKALKSNKNYEYWGKMYLFNEKTVNESKKKNWSQVFNEFKNSGMEFMKVYDDITDELLEKKIWKDKIYTPKRILEINIHHYQKAQLVQIKKYLTNWGIC